MSVSTPCSLLPFLWLYLLPSQPSFLPSLQKQTHFSHRLSQSTAWPSEISSLIPSTYQGVVFFLPNNESGANISIKLFSSSHYMFEDFYFLFLLSILLISMCWLYGHGREISLDRNILGKKKLVLECHFYINA